MITRIKEYWDELDDRGKLRIQCGGGAILMSVVTLIMYYLVLEAIKHWEMMQI